MVYDAASEPYDASGKSLAQLEKDIVKGREEIEAGFKELDKRLAGDESILWDPS